MNRRILIITMALLLFFSVSGCISSREKVSPLDLIKTYRDVPDVTDEEISAIEALKSTKENFTYGVLLGTESFILPDGSYAGFAIKLCQILSELFGINFVPQFYEWDELMSSLESLSVDFTGELTPTRERMQVYFMTYPIAERLLRIFTLASSDKIQNESDVEGLKIGFLEDTITADTIKKNYPVQFISVYVDNYHAAAIMMQNGEIDAFVDEAVADPAFDEYDFINSKVFFPLVHEPVSMTTANPDLAYIISVVDKYIAAGGVDNLYDLYKESDFEYAKYKLNRSFTDEERAYIDDLNQRGASVAVAFDNESYPVTFYNETEKEFEGIAVDVLAEISRITDIKFKSATTKDDIWSDILERTKTGEIRMVAQLLRSEARKKYFIWSAVPYSYSYYSIMSKSDYPNLASYQIIRATVGVMKSSGHQDIYRELFPENDNLREYYTVEECLDALERGEVDLVMASEHMLLSQTNYREKTGFKTNIKFDTPMDSYFGFHKDEIILCSIIDKAQQYVRTSEIEMGWTGKVFDYSKKLAEERSFFLMILVAVLFLGFMSTVFLLVRNIRLSGKLKEIATKDALTNIFNRRYFMELALIQIDRALRIGSECFIIIFDLDRFKVVNDTYGHLAGDKVLKEAAQRVKRATRTYDFLGRYGGEEFIILMTDIDKTNVINAVERIRLDLCKTPINFEDKEITVSASFGISYAAPINDLNIATKYADKALYQAKNTGRNKVVFYEDDVN